LGSVETSIEDVPELSLRKEVSRIVNRASLYVFLVTAVLLLAIIAGGGFPDGP
jgi:hypothetical protein